MAKLIIMESKSQSCGPELMWSYKIHTGDSVGSYESGEVTEKHEMRDRTFGFYRYIRVEQTLTSGTTTCYEKHLCLLYALLPGLSHVTGAGKLRLR